MIQVEGAKLDMIVGFNMHSRICLGSISKEGTQSHSQV